MRELEPIWPGAPRYGPDEPLPPYRFLGGLHPHPTRDPAGHSYGAEAESEHMPAESWREDAGYLRGIDLYHAGYLWEAHEAWESIWKASPDPVQRDFLQGLIQLAASRIKRHVGNARGAAVLAARARERLERVPSVYMGLDVRAILAADSPRLEPR